MMTFDVEVLLKGTNEVVAETVTYDGPEPAGWTDADVREVLLSTLRVFDRTGISSSLRRLSSEGGSRIPVPVTRSSPAHWRSRLSYVSIHDHLGVAPFRAENTSPQTRACRIGSVSTTVRSEDATAGRSCGYTRESLPSFGCHSLQDGSGGLFRLGERWANIWKAMYLGDGERVEPGRMRRDNIDVSEQSAHRLRQLRHPSLKPDCGVGTTISKGFSGLHSIVTFTRTLTPRGL